MNKSKKVMRIRRNYPRDLMIWTQQQVPRMETSDTPHVLPSPLEELLPQTVEDLPVDVVEEPTHPPEEVVERAAQRPVPVSRGGQDTASPQISETYPGQGMRQTHTDRPTRIRKKLSKFST